MKIFISQPMKGLSRQEIEDTRDGIIAGLKNEYGDDVEILDTFFINPEEVGLSKLSKPLEFFAKSIEYLAKADKAYFADGWENTRGCALEHIICEKFDVEIIHD